MNMQVDLSCLEALEAVVKYGGFAHASKHLHKVQSAISSGARLQTAAVDRKARVRRVVEVWQQMHDLITTQELAIDTVQERDVGLAPARPTGPRCAPARLALAEKTSR
jgi:hypothetical protein